MKTEIICIGTTETIAKIWHGFYASGRLIMMNRQPEGTKWIATFVILSKYAEIIS